MKVVTWAAMALWCVPALAQDGQPSTPETDQAAAVDEGAASPAGTDEPPPADSNRTAVEVVLLNGIVLTGTVQTADAVSWAPGQPLRFTPDDGEAMELAADKITAVRAPTPAPVMVPRVLESPNYRSPNGFKTENRGKSRHLYAPSSMGLKQGEGYYSQKFVFSAVAYGVTDNLTLLGGTFSFYPPLLTVVGAKVSKEVAPDVHLAAGGEVFLSTLADEFSSLARLAFGGVTVGHSDAQVTVSAGYASLGTDNDANGIPLIVAGQWRTGERGALVTENWMIFSSGSGEDTLLSSEGAFVLSGAYRIFGPAHSRWSFDLGLVSLGVDADLLLPVPWVDFAYHFGKQKQ